MNGYIAFSTQDVEVHTIPLIIFFSSNRIFKFSLQISIFDYVFNAVLVELGVK